MDLGMDAQPGRGRVDALSPVAHLESCHVHVCPVSAESSVL